MRSAMSGVAVAEAGEPARHGERAAEKGQRQVHQPRRPADTSRDPGDHLAVGERLASGRVVGAIEGVGVVQDGEGGAGQVGGVDRLSSPPPLPGDREEAEALHEAGDRAHVSVAPSAVDERRTEDRPADLPLAAGSLHGLLGLGQASSGLTLSRAAGALLREPARRAEGHEPAHARLGRRGKPRRQQPDRRRVHEARRRPRTDSREPRRFRPRPAGHPGPASASGSSPRRRSGRTASAGG